MARTIASREEEVRARMNEESRKGRDFFNAADARTRNELLHAWMTSREGKLMLRRMKLESIDGDGGCHPREHGTGLVSGAVRLRADKFVVAHRRECPHEHLRVSKQVAVATFLNHWRP